MRIKILALTAIMMLSTALSACDSGSNTPTSNSNTTPASAPTQSNSGGPGGGVNLKPVVVSSKNFPEEVILGELYAIMLELVNVPVERKLNLGTTAIAQEALLKGGENGGIDLYPEYTSTGLITVLKDAAISDPDQAYDAVKKGYKEKFNLTWLDKTPMNDTQAIVTTQEVSDSKGLKSLDDLCSKAGDLTIAIRPEFKTREDALPALQKIYGGCEFKDYKIVDSADLLYQSLVNKNVDVAQADGTAGEIAGLKLVLLADPKNYGPPDNVAPVVRDDVLAKYPQIATSLNKLSALITNEEISQMNWDVTGNKMDPHDVAKIWLDKKGLLNR